MSLYRLGVRPVVAAALLVTGVAAIAPALTSAAGSTARAQDTSTGREPGSTRVFARFAAIDGESDDRTHGKWIDVLAISWGAHRSRSKSGKVRRRGASIVEDLVLTVEYDKAAPKLQEMCLTGQSIPTVEVDMTATFGSASAGFLKHELKNVAVLNYQMNASGNDEAGPPTVVVGLSFDEVTVTYTEFDEAGSPIGDVGYVFDVE